MVKKTSDERCLPVHFLITVLGLLDHKQKQQRAHF